MKFYLISADIFGENWETQCHKLMIHYIIVALMLYSFGIIVESIVSFQDA